MMGLMVKNVPTICIDGQITFVSIIPAPTELAAAIQRRINEKMHIRIREQRSRLLILTDDDEEGHIAWENAQQAAKELGSTVEIIHIQDVESRKKYGITGVPAVITTKQHVKSIGNVPSVEVMKEWLKDLK